MDDPPDGVAQEQHTSLTVRGPDGHNWKLGLLIGITVAAMVVTGLTIGYTLTRQDAQTNAAQEDVQVNRDVLVALCSSLTTLRFVFEQLEALDRRIARDPSLAPRVAADVRARATLYATATVALSDVKECTKIE